MHAFFLAALLLGVHPVHPVLLPPIWYAPSWYVRVPVVHGVVYHSNYHKPKPKKKPAHLVELVEYDPENSLGSPILINAADIQTVRSYRPDGEEIGASKVTLRSGKTIALWGSPDQVRVDVQRQAPKKKPPQKPQGGCAGGHCPVVKHGP